MKVTSEEMQIQGGMPCSICGSLTPCGDIFECAWWVSEEPVRDNERDQEYRRQYEREMERHFNLIFEEWDEQRKYDYE